MQQITELTGVNNNLHDVYSRTTDKMVSALAQFSFLIYNLNNNIT